MAKEDDVLIQLATRIPKGLHREIKLFCVHNGISVMEFVAAALEEPGESAEVSRVVEAFLYVLGLDGRLTDVDGARAKDEVIHAFHVVFEGLAGLAPGIQGGGVKLLGVAARERLPNLPNLPAINETVPGVVSSGWIVLMAPAGTPESVVQKVNADLRKVVAMPEVMERFQTLGTYTRDLTPAQTGEFIRSEERLWWPVVRQVNQNR